MKKTIQALIIIILVLIIGLIIIFAFNPFNLRTKIISRAINTYLQSTMESYQPLDSSVDVSKLPTEITPAMQDCAVEKLGEARAQELINGATPGPMDILRAKDCLSK